jgi:hypothetical protein
VGKVGLDCFDRALAAASIRGYLGRGQCPVENHIADQMMLRGSKIQGHFRINKSCAELGFGSSRVVDAQYTTIEAVYRLSVVVDTRT